MARRKWVPKYRYGTGHHRVHYTSYLIERFLQYVIQKRALPIEHVLSDLAEHFSFFLVAATGLGKTVAVPLWLLYRQMRDERVHVSGISPRIWVVEPRISICQNLQREMNGLWVEWRRVAGHSASPLFGAKTRVDRVHTIAPIMFITTGIFAIYARNGLFQSGRDVVLVDEAHETLEADESVELAVGICRMFNVDIHFMSATIDAANIPRLLDACVVKAAGSRQHVWRHNTHAPLLDCVVEMVECALVRQDTSSAYFPPRSTAHANEIIHSVTETGRAKGMLIIVNSFASERSEARRVEKCLREAFEPSEVEIGLLASEVLKNRTRKAAYEALLQRWQREGRKYVLIATSVVEMGVTLPDLDFVVTMDVGFKKKPLGTNALIQRIGRVGRQRPGIAYITREIGVAYAELDDEALNAPDTIVPEPIAFPMREGSLTPLAYFTFEREWGPELTFGMLHTHLPIPSCYPLKYEEWHDRLEEERERLVRIGVATAHPPALTAEGILMERWVGRGDLEHAMRAQRAVEAGVEDIEMFTVALHEIAAAQVSWERMFPRMIEKTGPIHWMPVRLIMMFYLLSLEKIRGVYAKRELAERMMDEIVRFEASWEGMMEFIAAFGEALEISLEINGHRKGFDLIQAWHDTILQFVQRPPE